MRLKNKVFVIIASIWILFFGLSSIESIRYSLETYTSLVVVFFLLTACLLERYIVKPVGEIDKKVDDINNQLNLEISEKVYLENKLNNTKQETLVGLGHYDDLTALPNRVFFNETLNKAISHAKRHKKTLAIMLINIDKFKSINEAIGKQSGDKIIKDLANRFITTLRSEDVLARLNGDEFIILLNDVSKPKFASAVAEKLLAACSAPFKAGDSNLTLNISIGISIFPNDGESLEQLLINVEKALYKAKKIGVKKYQFYTHEMDVEAHEYIKLETALRSALENKELAIYYQPKLHIKQGNIAGVEALIRWVHPELGVINPAKFIPIAEETGLITKIGEWAIYEACRVNKHWQDEGYEHFTIAVNISSKQFYNPNIDSVISKILTDTGLNPKYLELEITESSVMENVELALKILDKLKAIGIQLSIDHFGTAYTSISHLKQFPVSIIKIDRYYIKGIPNSPDDTAITSAIIALAHNLGLEVVAEGVETAEQVQYLADHNCDMVQGYFLSHPLPEQKIVLQFKKLIDEVLI